MRSALLAVTLAMACAATAAADPITLAPFSVRVTAGSVQVLPGESTVGPPELGPHGTAALTGSSGFELAGSGPAVVACESGCAPGGAFSLSAGIALLQGTVNARGQALEFDALGTAGGGGTLHLEGDRFVLPATGGGTIAFESPFVLNGWVSAPGFLPPVDSEGDPTPVDHLFLLSGAGTATGTYAFDRLDGADVIRFGGLRFEFQEAPAPIPEPGSMLLLAGGLAALCARRRKKTAND